jgi:hypothetical protein
MEENDPTVAYRAGYIDGFEAAIQAIRRGLEGASGGEVADALFVYWDTTLLKWHESYVIVKYDRDEQQPPLFVYQED